MKRGIIRRLAIAVGVFSVLVAGFAGAQRTSRSPRAHLSLQASILAKRLATTPLDSIHVDRLLEAHRTAATYREILFYGDGPAVRAAARCLVQLRDQVTVDSVLTRAEAGELGPSRYPAALFGWVVGASYDAKLLPRLQPLLRVTDNATRIFALHALETMTYLRWSMPESEPAFANPGRIWSLDRWLRRVHREEWIGDRIQPMLRGLPKAQRDRAASYLARYRPETKSKGPVLRFSLRVASARRTR